MSRLTALLFTSAAIACGAQFTGTDTEDGGFSGSAGRAGVPDAGYGGRSGSSTGNPDGAAGTAKGGAAGKAGAGGAGAAPGSGGTSGSGGMSGTAGMAGTRDGGAGRAGAGGATDGGAGRAGAGGAADGGAGRAGAGGAAGSTGKGGSSGTSGAAGTSGGSAGSGGTGSGGKAGSGGSAGIGGSAGSAGASGSAGRGGIGGTAGAPVDAGRDASDTGTSCTMGTQCVSGYCVDGRCCENACDTPCYACNLAGSLGLCRAITTGPDDNASALCTGSQTCCEGTCRDLNSVDSCGLSCQKCTVSSDREVPTCNGSACGSACRNDDPRCGDDSCSRLLWNFDSGTLDGITVRMAGSSPLAVRDFNGNLALAADVAQLNQIPEISFTIPICVSGAVDLRAKTLSFRIFFDGSPPTQVDFFVQAAVPTPQADAYLDQIGAGTGAWTTYSSPMSKSTFSASTTAITIQAGSLGGPFSGTIWFDDIKVE